ncbi:hypothetical protein COU61_01060 [Candidatus Pacearchaeota archaeon CG10_big_fil_rev_8_21_14_0_10_35_13]|nr:MAG: hypothetical protein COU61_01060 [Candidatus Pacearchaeota archaeon CG10_big_fil_rev_8_21_14_0_10_35_13]
MEKEKTYKSGQMVKDKYGVERLRMTGSEVAQAYSWGMRDFSGTDLSHAYLAKTDLSGARFSEADLTATSFVKSDLKDADFRGSIVKGACFECADLSRAFFRERDIIGKGRPYGSLGGAFIELAEKSELYRYGLAGMFLD